MTKTFYLFIASIFVFFVSICLFIYGLFDHSMIDFHVEKEDEIKEETTQPPTQPPQMVAVQCPPGVILFTVCCALFFVLVLGFFAMDYTFTLPPTKEGSIPQFNEENQPTKKSSIHHFIEKKIAPYFLFIAVALIVILSIIIHKNNTLHTSSIILLTATIFIIITGKENRSQ